MLQNLPNGIHSKIDYTVSAERCKTVQRTWLSQCLKCDIMRYAVLPADTAVALASLTGAGDKLQLQRMTNVSQH